MFYVSVPITGYNPPDIFWYFSQLTQRVSIPVCLFPMFITLFNLHMSIIFSKILTMCDVGPYSEKKKNSKFLLLSLFFACASSSKTDNLQWFLQQNLWFLLFWIFTILFILLIILSLLFLVTGSVLYNELTLLVIIEIIFTDIFLILQYFNFLDLGFSIIFYFYEKYYHSLFM